MDEQTFESASGMERIKYCFNFPSCSVPQCPLDNNCQFVIRYRGESLCPFLEYALRRKKMNQVLKAAVPEINEGLFYEPERWSLGK